MRLLVTVLAILLITGCGGGERETPAAADTVSAADVMFLQMMIEHHKQSIEIVRLASKKATTEEVRTLAGAIAVTEATEVHTMMERLHSWDQPLSASADAHAGHGGMPQTSAKEMTALRKADRADFDRDFLNLLIAHLDDSVQMADEEVAKGANPPTVELARRISRAQTAQIDHMLGLLAGLDAPTPSA
ncbi:DUF305 domain-containing protein [Streptosporangium sp. KLBMP 9127]|nr:DUF305 domain-containing protein [Streptosporangium sp. KLBMP 9127]